MSKVSRKEFLSITALLAGATLLPRRVLGLAPRAAMAGDAPVVKGAGIVADFVVVNARVLTSDPSLARAHRRSQSARESSLRSAPLAISGTLSDAARESLMLRG